MAENNVKTNGNSIKWTQMGIIIIVISAIVSVVNFVTKPDMEIREQLIRLEEHVLLIETNELAHIAADIKVNYDTNKDQFDKLNEIDKKLTEVLTILKQYER